MIQARSIYKLDEDRVYHGALESSELGDNHLQLISSYVHKS
jgi:hypothetical protein